MIDHTGKQQNRVKNPRWKRKKQSYERPDQAHCAVIG